LRDRRKFGLIGKNIEYSFSRKYFLEKFSSDINLTGYNYENFDIESINLINSFISDKDLGGLNVTIPYKEEIIPYLDALTDEAKEIGAVNTICFENNKKIGYNTDIFGFTESLKVNSINNIKAMIIMGTGGAAKTIIHFCKKNKIHFKGNVLIVNCTPVGTYPNINKCPDLPYNLLEKENILYDLVYNPSETLFIKKGKEIGCKTLNGYEMLKFQAEMSWNLWTKSLK
jgi:shikimate dehydrogenase